MKAWTTRASKMTVPRVGLNGEGNGSDDIDDSDYSGTDY